MEKSQLTRARKVRGREREGRERERRKRRRAQNFSLKVFFFFLALSERRKKVHFDPIKTCSFRARFSLLPPLQASQQHHACAPVRQEPLSPPATPRRAEGEALRFLLGRKKRAGVVVPTSSLLAISSLPLSAHSLTLVSPPPSSRRRISQNRRDWTRGEKNLKR